MVLLSAAAMMTEALMRKYPRRYDVPSEAEVQSFINAKCSAQRSEAARPRGRNAKMGALYMHHIIRIFCESRGLIKPKKALELVRLALDTSAEDFPSDKQIKAKISSLKVTYKKTKRLPNVPPPPRSA